MEHTRKLASYCSSVTYETLPPAAIHMAKRLMLDTIGTTVAATTLGDGCQQLQKLKAAGTGAALMGRGRSVDPLSAALINGGTGHALNFDASGPVGHVGSILAAPYAIAQARGFTSGRRFLAALVAGYETIARMTSVIRANSNASQIPVDKVLEGQLLGYFGAAAACGNILGFDAARMHSAFGLALMQAAGTMQVVFDGDPPGKAIYAAFSNHGGLLSTLLAEQGIGCEVDVLAGPAGLFGLYYAKGWDVSPATTDLGQTFHFTGANFKPWPSSGITHPFVEAIQKIAPQDISTVESVRLRGGTRSRHWFEPEEERRSPQSSASAANSIFYVVARMLEEHQVTLAHFTPAVLARRPKSIDLMTHSLEDDLGSSAIVELKLRDGFVLSQRVDHPLGTPKNPMSDSQIIDKFKACASFSATPIDADAVVEAIWSLENRDLTGLHSLV